MAKAEESRFQKALDDMRFELVKVEIGGIERYAYVGEMRLKRTMCFDYEPDEETLAEVRRVTRNDIKQDVYRGIEEGLHEVYDLVSAMSVTAIRADGIEYYYDAQERHLKEKEECLLRIDEVIESVAARRKGGL